MPSPTLTKQTSPSPPFTATPANTRPDRVATPALDMMTWDQAVAQARVERVGALYADSARAAIAIQALVRLQPDLAITTLTLSSADIQDRFLSTPQADASGADAYLAGDPLRTFALLNAGYLVNYVPIDQASTLPDAMREPLLVHHWSAVTLVYNTAQGSSPPVDNWWDLTRPEWRGRVALPDPLVDERALCLLSIIAQHGDDFSASHRAEFGQEVTLSADCPNAGYQWIKALLANEPRLALSDAEVAQWVGDPQAETMRVGICGSEQYSKVIWGELAFAPMQAASPTAGIQWPTYLALTSHAPHPAVGRLLVHWMMSSDGYTPWAVAGIYPSRTDFPDPPGAAPRAELEPRLWKPDPEYLADNMLTVRDQIAAYLGRQVGGR